MPGTEKQQTRSGESERKRQESLPWKRSEYPNYYSVLAFFQAQSVIENTQGKSLLDVGCGDGRIFAHLSSKFERIVGVDASLSNLAEARAKCPNGEFHESLLEDFETKEKFDVVVLLDGLQYVKDPASTLQNSALFSKQDGMLVVHVPNALAVNRHIARVMGVLSDEHELWPYDVGVGGHPRRYDRYLLEKDIQTAGLQVVSTGGIMYTMLSTPQMDWLLRTGHWERGDFGWGRTGEEKMDWKFQFCRACYEYGKMRPDECDVIYACAKNPGQIPPIVNYHRFIRERHRDINRMASDRRVMRLGQLFMVETLKYKYSYNFEWLGRPVIQLPQDLAALQEIVWQVRPDLIIETGIAHGGGLIFYASMLELLGGNGMVLGIDIDIREPNRLMIQTHPMAKRIKMIQGSSVDISVVQLVHDFARTRDRLLVVLDSNHTEEHVLKELELYSPLVKKGSYLVVLDTTIEDLPEQSFPDRPWRKSNNPKTAVRRFLKKNKRFLIDTNIENKLVITAARGGYLKCVRD